MLLKRNIRNSSEAISEKRTWHCTCGDGKVGARTAGSLRRGMPDDGKSQEEFHGLGFFLWFTVIVQKLVCCLGHSRQTISIVLSK